MHALILGNHPLRDSLIRQCQQRGDEVKALVALGDDIAVDDFGELFLLADDTCDPLESDQRQMALLLQIASGFHPEFHQGQRLKCHLMLLCDVTMELLQSEEIICQVTQTVDVYPFILDEEWCRRIRYDHEPITVHSEKIVHVVVVGWSRFAERMVMNAAHVAHYPNYLHNHTLRTRITIIHNDDLADFRGRNKVLFDNSFYRVIGNGFKEYDFHAPDTAVGGEITDIEWEFVKASLYDKVVEVKLQLWSRQTEQQVLTVALAHDDNEKNLDEALHVARLTADIPIYLRVNTTTLLNQMSDKGLLARIKLIGMQNEGYDIRTPLVEMAKTVNVVYQELRKERPESKESTSLRDLTFAAQINNKERMQAWENLPLVNRMSSIYHAMSIPTKMRSVGIADDEWGHFYDLSLQDIEQMARVEHNRWCTAALMMGFRPCTAEERATIEKDIRQKEEWKKKRVHYDLCSYELLGVDVHGVHVTEYDLRLCASMPLIVKSVASENEETT